MICMLIGSTFHVQLAFHIVPYLADPHELRKYPAAGPFGIGEAEKRVLCWRSAFTDMHYAYSRLY